MIIVPKDNPIITDLNSYYLIMGKLFEHYQGVVNSGCIHFKSPTSEGAVFFDDENIINAIFKNKVNTVKGKKAIDILIGESGSNNFSVAIYEIPQERITFWANVVEAQDLHKDLSTEFTDLESLVKKMINEKLTGYIEISFDAENNAVLFLLNGDLINSASSDNKWQLSNNENILKALVEKTRQTGAILNVRKIPLNQKNVILSEQNVEKIAPVVVQKKQIVAEEKPKPLNIIEMLQHLMLIYEKFISGTRRIRDDFDTILKRKFMEKVDKFDFLDPFAAEFKYSNGKINYFGQASHIQLASGLMECLNEIAVENQMQEWLKKHLGPWEEKYSKEIEAVKSNV